MSNVSELLELMIERHGPYFYGFHSLGNLKSYWVEQGLWQEDDDKEHAEMVRAKVVSFLQESVH